MKRQYKAALGIAGIVIVTTLIGVGIFLYFGSEVGVYVVGAGVPIAVVTAIGLYVRGTIARRNTSEGEFVREIARSIGADFRDELTTFSRLQGTYPRWDATAVQTKAEQLAGDFGSAGVDVDAADGTFTVQNPGPVKELESLSDRIEEFSDSYTASFRDFAREEIERSQDAALHVRRDFLDGDVEDAPATDLSPEASADDVERVVEHVRGETTDEFERAANRIEDTVAGYDRDPARVDAHLETARKHMDAHEWEAAIDALTKARRLVEREVDDEFSADREALEQLLDTVEKVDVDPHASDESLDTFANIRSQLDELQSALSADQLDDAAAQARLAALDVVADLESDLDRHVQTIRNADVPMGFYTAPPAVATDYAAKLETVDDLATFRTRWLSATGELLDAVDTAEMKASVADSYNVVADRIEDELRSNGEVTADDLPVRDSDPFLELYADANPAVEYDSAVPAVRARGTDERYSVAVTAQLSSSTGDQHELTVTLSGHDVEERAVETTYVATEVTFDEIPYGEYTLSAETPTEAFSDVESTIQVSDDVSETLVLQEVSLRDRVCGEYGDEVRDQLPGIAPELESAFSDDEYLTPDSDIPVADEYVPCLLVLWAEEAGYTVRMDEDRLLVYDHDQFESRLQTIATHNVSDETITFDEMRTKFLSVPASDELITNTLRDLNLDVSVDELGVSA